LPHARLQNGTVKSNEELVKLLNDADVPGTDVVGESGPPPLLAAALYGLASLPCAGTGAAQREAGRRSKGTEISCD
jgi:hypothetical protein